MSCHDCQVRTDSFGRSARYESSKKNEESAEDKTKENRRATLVAASRKARGGGGRDLRVSIDVLEPENGFSPGPSFVSPTWQAASRGFHSTFFNGKLSDGSNAPPPPKKKQTITYAFCAANHQDEIHTRKAQDSSCLVQDPSKRHPAKTRKNVFFS